MDKKKPDQRRQMAANLRAVQTNDRHECCAKSSAEKLPTSTTCCVGECNWDTPDVPAEWPSLSRTDLQDAVSGRVGLTPQRRLHAMCYTSKPKIIRRRTGSNRRNGRWQIDWGGPLRTPSRLRSASSIEGSRGPISKKSMTLTGFDRDAQKPSNWDVL